MKCKLIINKECEEEVVIYAHRRSKLVDEIERLVETDATEFTGYREGEIYKLSPSEVFCFIAEDNKVYALTDKGRLRIKLRLYQLEEILSNGFIKINQSCIANIKEIKNFDASISGTLTVIFKSGYKDYVSRRNVKAIKERLGVK